MDGGRDRTPPPGWAAVRTRFHTVLGPEQGNYEFGGMITMILERQGQDWKIVSGHTSSERKRGG